MIGFEESDKLCCKHSMFLFWWQNKGRYISHYMSTTQYKSGENQEICVQIVALWLHLIRNLWVLYVSILSISHKLIISVGYDSALWELMPIGLIPRFLFNCL